MKSHLATLVIALIVGFFGGVSSQFFKSKPTPVEQSQETLNTDFSSPFQTRTGPNDFALQIAQMQKKIHWLEIQLDEVTQNQTTITEGLKDKTKNLTETSINQAPAVASPKDNLVSAGVNPDIADDILRRISQQQFRKMELSNLMRRNASSGARQYSDELRELAQNGISLRSELGDDIYDQYLFVSGQNNRVKVASVMAGSPAESNGVLKDDVILYYGDKKIITWDDIKKATLDGEVGSFTNVEILRDGNRMSLMVPRGTLGVQLNVIKLDPAS